MTRQDLKNYIGKLFRQNTDLFLITDAEWSATGVHMFRIYGLRLDYMFYEYAAVVLQSKTVELLASSTVEPPTIR